MGVGVSHWQARTASTFIIVNLKVVCWCGQGSQVIKYQTHPNLMVHCDKVMLEQNRAFSKQTDVQRVEMSKNLLGKMKNSGIPYIVSKV